MKDAFVKNVQKCFYAPERCRNFSFFLFSVFHHFHHFSPWLAGDGLVWLQSLILGQPLCGGIGYRQMDVETMIASPSRGEECFFLTSKGWETNPRSVGQEIGPTGPTFHGPLNLGI